jgi:hypothetical protein
VLDPTPLVDVIGVEYRRAEAALIARLAGQELVAADRSAQIATPTLQPEKTQ